VSAHLQDDHILVLTGPELIDANRAIQWYIEDQKRRNGGAPRMAAWAQLARRGANITTKAMFADEPRTRTFEEVEAESEPDVDHSQEMTAVEAAEYLDITPTHCRRIRGQIGTSGERPIRFSRDAVIAYKMHRDEKGAVNGGSCRGPKVGDQTWLHQ
jgi:hypothetical protein